jgi:hypothetical protein
MIVKVLRYGLGLGAYAMAFFLSAKGFIVGGLVGIGMILQAIFLGGVGFLFLNPLILRPLERVGRLFYPDALSSRSDFSQIDGLIVRHRYEEALKELDELLAGELSAAGELKRCELLCDKLGRREQAVELGLCRLGVSHLAEEDERLLLLISDIFLDAGDKSAALELLRRCIVRFADGKARERLQKRLDNLSP